MLSDRNITVASTEINAPESSLIPYNNYCQALDVIYITEVSLYKLLEQYSLLQSFYIILYDGIIAL